MLSIQDLEDQITGLVKGDLRRAARECDKQRVLFTALRIAALADLLFHFTDGDSVPVVADDTEG